MSNAKSLTPPTHIIWQVIDTNDKPYWSRIGAAWENRDGKGLSLKFDSYPVHGRTVIRTVEEQDRSGDNTGD